MGNCLGTDTPTNKPNSNNNNSNNTTGNASNSPTTNSNTGAMVPSSGKRQVKVLLLGSGDTGKRYVVNNSNTLEQTSNSTLLL
jgi:predicted GTPase